MLIASSFAWLSGHIALTEVLWTLFGVFGAIYSAQNLHDASQNITALRAAGRNGAMRAIAYSHLRTEAFRLLINGMTIVSGVAAMTAAPANADAPIGPVQVIIVLTIFGINAITGLQSYLDKRLREGLPDIENSQH